MSGPDVIVVGGGHNGLVAALTLAEGGRKVTVVERAGALGGICARREFAPGYHAPGLVSETGRFRDDLVESLGLAAHGLEFEADESPTLAPDDDGGLLLYEDPSRTARALAEAEDAAALRDWNGFLRQITPAVRRLLDAPPPALGPAGLDDFKGLAGTAWSLRRLGGDTMTELLRVLPMCVADWMRERFASERLAAGLAAPALTNGYGGPWAPGTAAALIWRQCARGRTVRGGPGALVDALAAACGEAGVELVTDAAVRRIHVDGDGVDAVELESGERLEAPRVIATCNPKTALLDLVGARYLPSDLERALRNVRSRGIVSVLLLAVADDLEVAARPGEGVDRLRLGAESLDDLERAFDAVKYRRRADRPYLEVWIPSLSIPDLAPAGCHVVTALVHATPYDLAGGWSNEVREALTQAVVHRLNDELPGLREALAGGRLLTPPDLEAELGLPGGHLGHGEMALDQMLFLRPTRELARYRTPIDGLYVGGMGSHPGPGVTGVPGRLAARALLADSE
ncbi:MAG: NAD(P)/FAD-dependent oxidoreductase [Thermoanaerobaculia bacterium]|nr:NAD(P)/FAD-dependent oxidoreductase [Thermoanaerobaculia bacterium]